MIMMHSLGEYLARGFDVFATSDDHTTSVVVYQNRSVIGGQLCRRVNVHRNRTCQYDDAIIIPPYTAACGSCTPIENMLYWLQYFMDDTANNTGWSKKVSHYQELSLN